MLWMQALIVAGLLHGVAGRSRLLAIALAPLVFIPLGDGNSIATALRSLWGDPSITTVQLLLLTLSGAALADLRHGWRVPALAVVAGALLYASALGPWNIDLYRLGYQPAYLVALTGALALAAWWRGQALYLWLLVIDLFAWRMGWLESTNFWDSLLDPLLLFVMLALALRNGYRAHRNRIKHLAKL